MKTVRMLGREKVEVVDLPDPEPKDDLVVVKVMSSALCGSEKAAYFGEAALDSNAGHEAAGIVWKTDRARLVKEGDRVSLFAAGHCNRCPDCWSGNWVRCRNAAPSLRQPGNHSQLVLLREDLCLPLPDDISFETGALLQDALGTPYRAIKRLGVSAFDTVLITGAGPIGAAAAIISRFLNSRVIAVDVNDLRLQHVRRCGVEYTIDPSKDDVLQTVMEITGNRGVDVALDCSGVDTAQLQCLDAAVSGGRVAFLGIKAESTAVNVLRHLILKDLTLIGSWYTSPSEHPEIIALIQRGLPADRLITHRFALDAAPQAFRTFFGGEGVKVLIDPWKV